MKVKLVKGQPVMVSCGPGIYEKDTVKNVGSAGFSVRGRISAFWWKDEGKTWRPPTAEESKR